MPRLRHCLHSICIGFLFCFFNKLLSLNIVEWVILKCLQGLHACIVTKIYASFLFQILIIELGKHSSIIFIIVYLHRHSMIDLGLFMIHQLYKTLIEG